ncbi:MAG TPA: DUF2007 domain-containing protein [Dehalococcoidia bacterium]|nr:DUF2007 domain-containing protein [Dehalococcoidia bacterium]
MASAGLVRLVAAADEVEAERMRRALLAAGIRSVVRNVDPLSVMHRLPPPPFSLVLFVREDELEEARTLLGLEEGLAG